MKCAAVTAAMILLAPIACASGAAPASAPAADYMPVNLDHALTSPLTLDAQNTPLASIADSVRSQTHTNIVLNWPALAGAGITRETPVTLHLKDISFEQIVKTLCDILPAKDSRVNYTVGDNILTITTDVELGKINVPVIEDITRIVGYTLEKESNDGQKTENEKFLESFFKAALTQAGEPMDAKGHALAVRQATLAGTVSNRGRQILEKALRQLNAPTRPGQFVAGTQLTADAKKATALFNAAHDQSLADLVLQAADHPRGLNIALLPNTLDPQTQKPIDPLASTITDGGVLLIGPRNAISERTVLGIYDLRDIIKHEVAKSRQKMSATDARDAALASLEATITPGEPPETQWSKMGAAPSSMDTFNGLLVVFATPEKHRAITEALHKMLQ